MFTYEEKAPNHGISLHVRDLLTVAIHQIIIILFKRKFFINVEKGGMNAMKKFNYDITAHPVETFKQVAFFCTQEGECSLEELPSDQIKILKDLLNERGERGWELVDMAFGKDGLLAIWKTAVKET